MEAYRANALFAAHRDDPEFGHRLLADEARDAGEAMSDRTAWKIASENCWWSAFGKKKASGKGRKAGPPVHDDLVRREFTADAPNRLWLTDITEHRTSEGKLYLCAIKDVFSNKNVGYSIDSRMKSRLVVNAIGNAADLLRRYHGLDEPVFPSTAGTFRSPNNFRRQLREALNGTGFEWVTPHSFRRTVATLLDQERSTDDAAAQLGHSDTAVTKAHYIAKAHRAQTCPTYSNRWPDPLSGHPRWACKSVYFVTSTSQVAREATCHALSEACFSFDLLRHGLTK
ncbi:MAG: tyrosine-type recombinase/integrase [Propionibacteriaceae bacterium]|nr:tyrosine-type recombinase/integrase [Propionibacteriaceae bacterium]